MNMTLVRAHTARGRARYTCAPESRGGHDVSEVIPISFSSLN